MMAKVEERTPYIIVAFQECERMNILMREIRRSLKELNLGLKARFLFNSYNNQMKFISLYLLHQMKNKTN